MTGDLGTDIGAPLRTLLEAARRSSPGAVVARVDRFDAQSCTVDATPVVWDWRTVRGERVWIQPQRIDGVPVLMGAGASITQGIAVGALVTLVRRGASHDQVDAGSPLAGGIQPRSTQRNRLTDAVAIPGYIVPATGRDASEYRSDGQPVWALGAGEALHIGASTAALLIARADLILAELQALQTGLNNHVHTVSLPVTGGAGGTVSGSTNPGGTYTAPAAASDIASDRIKVDS